MIVVKVVDDLSARLVFLIDDFCDGVGFFCLIVFFLLIILEMVFHDFSAGWMMLTGNSGDGG